MLKVEEEKIRNYIFNYSGIDLNENNLLLFRPILQKRMNINRCKSVTEYLNFLNNSTDKELEIKELINEMTIKHTFFFRNRDHFEVLEKKVIPEIIKRKRFKEKKIRILSAGCASGEEAYSIAITLFETIPYPETWNLEVVAGDISKDALDKTRNGIYTKKSLLEVKNEYIHKFFIPVNNTREMFRISDEIKKIVTIKYLNLMDKKYPGDFDIIFCRNVIIYLNKGYHSKIIDKFYDSLNDDGYLFLGHSESLLGISNKFRLKDFDLAMVYKKYSQKEIDEKDAIEIFVPPVIDDNYCKEIITKSKIEKTIIPIQLEKQKKQQYGKDTSELFIEARTFFEIKKYDEALNLCQKSIELKSDFTECLILLIEIYANMGKLDDAILECHNLLNKKTDFASGYFMLGIFYSRKELFLEAKEQFKKSLYLDNTISMAYFNLATIYQREGEMNNAVREYKNTINSLKSYREDDEVEYSGGFRVGIIMNSCLNNLLELEKLIIKRENHG